MGQGLWCGRGGLGWTDYGIGFFEELIFEWWAVAFASGEVGIVALKEVVQRWCKIGHVIDAAIQVIRCQ